MNILVTGASGFIASQVVTDLLAGAHNVTCCVRNVRYTKTIFPQTTVIPCNFHKDISQDDWIPGLKNIDVVINCVGILYHPNKNIIWAVHYNTPKALFAACVTAGVKKIIQISALGVDKLQVDYAKSKKATEEYLQTLPIPSIVLRPSLVYGRGSYAGTSLFRGLAGGLPFIIPIPGKGNQTFQPIHVQDLSRAILILVNTPVSKNLILSSVCEKRINLREILTHLRAWLGVSSARLLFIPLFVIRIAAFFGDIIPYSALNSSAFKMLKENNVADDVEMKKFQEIIQFQPKNFIEGVNSQPSTVQDHWHAKLFMLKPLLQVSIGFIWLWSGICGALLYPKSNSFEWLSQIGIQSSWQPFAVYGVSAVNALLGLATLCAYQIKKISVIQLAIILLYTIFITLKLPSSWLVPFGSLAKNIPLLVATLMFMALESDR
jgi:nucleoside-diphosphate-sugar epimerase